MIFVLGVLTLLALVGLVLIARTHGESQRLKIDSVALSSRSVMNGLVRTIQETLRQDIWGPNPDPIYPVPLNSQIAGNFRESNEPWDAPGASDRWLSSTTPYMITDDNGVPIPQTTGNPAAPTEDGVLAWKNVSYLGIDLLQSDGSDGAQPLLWTTNSRDGSSPVSYPPSVLQNVKVLQTPPAGMPGDLIPASTTNVTIAQARANWSPPSPGARFPYFDTNADGAVDLYDADGDGVPDSPISFVLPMDTADPNAPKQLYAVIRVVDHAGKLNANIASSIYLPSGSGTELMFDESLPGLQRRGTRMTELLLDDTVHPDDRNDYSNPPATRIARTRKLVSYRSGDDPVTYDADIVRRFLAGGTYTGPPNYFLYGLSDEASLRHRGMLVPYDRRFAPDEYRTIDRALRGTLAWSREVEPDGSYIGATARWNRLNSNLVDAANYEGSDVYPPVSPMSWRWMMREDEPYAIRRHLFTTISRETNVPPDITKGLALIPAAGETKLDTLLRQLWALGMDWPVLISSASPLATDPNRPSSPAITDKFVIPPDRMPAEWARVMPIDLGMQDADITAAKQAFVRYLAAAMYLALEGVQAYQGQWVRDDTTEPSPTPQDESLNREYFAWQFAINTADYRDADNEPTVIEWPSGSGHLLYGVEKQPFFTEAYAYLTAGNTPPTDEWFSAVELYVPPYWRIPTAELYLHSTGLSPDVGLIPINSFQQIPSAATLNELYGDPATGGTYYVFCGDPSNAPPDLAGGNGFYQNILFKFANDGNGEVELVYSPSGTSADPLTRAIDLISPAYSGDPLAGEGTTSGAGEFAKNPGGLPPGTNLAFSLLRSTHGWRFTTGWQVYTKAPSLGSFGDPPMRRSLGSANDTSDSLDNVVPPSIWPARFAFTNPSDGHDPPESFGPGPPFEAFDSPAEINRMLMFGPIRRNLPTDPPYFDNRSNPPVRFGVGQIPATILLAETAAKIQLPNGTTDDLSSINAQRIALGHIDFIAAKPVGTPPAPWSLRLLSYFTTQSPVFDGIDNDGLGGADLADPTEGAKVLNRVAGRININTAPVSVLRAVPFMSLLPNSAEFLALGASSGYVATVDAAADFVALGNAGLFYDMAAAIVAAREHRNLPLRLPTSVPGVLQPVATAKYTNPPRDAPGINGYFTSISELNRLRHIVDGGASANHALYRTDRFNYQPANPALGLYNHKYIAADPDLGASNVFSPDFRYRRVGAEYVADYVPITLTPPPANQFEYAGLRAREILLSRWSNMLTVRSDVFTAYIALLDGQGHYVQRCQVTLDRSECFRERPAVGLPGSVVLPRIVTRTDGSYEEEVH